MGLSLGFLFCPIWSICLFLCLYHTVWLLWLCSIVWSQGAWFLQLHFSFSRLFWCFLIFCISIQILKCFNSVKNDIGNSVAIELNMLTALCSSHFDSIESCSPRIWSLSIHLCCLHVLSSVSYRFQSIGFSLPTYVYSLVFYSFLCSGEWVVSLIAPFDLLLFMYRCATDFYVFSLLQPYQIYWWFLVIFW